MYTNMYNNVCETPMVPSYNPQPFPWLVNPMMTEGQDSFCMQEVAPTPLYVHQKRKHTSWLNLAALGGIAVGVGLLLRGKGKGISKVAKNVTNITNNNITNNTNITNITNITNKRFIYRRPKPPIPTPIPPKPPMPIPIPPKPPILKTVKDKLRLDFSGRKVKITRTLSGKTPEIWNLPIGKDGKIDFSSLSKETSEALSSFINGISSKRKGIAKELKSGHKFTVNGENGILTVMKNNGCKKNVTGVGGFFTNFTDLIKGIFGEGGNFLNY